MKHDEKGFRNNFRKFQASAKNVPCSTKLPLYWNIIEESMRKNDENANYIRDQVRSYNISRIIELEKKLGLN